MSLRVLQWGEPPRVFITERPHEVEHVQEYWIRNCTMTAAARAFQLLKTEAVTPHIRTFSIHQKHDLVERVQCYNTYLIVRVKGQQVIEDNLPDLRPIISAAFGTVQHTQVTWVTINKFLNMKVWRRKLAAPS